MPTVNAAVQTEVEVEVEVEVYCNSCGAHMCNETDSVVTPGRGRNAFRVNACSKCLDRAEGEGYDKGYDKGYADARKEFEREG